jgi:hypothetical protein
MKERGGCWEVLNIISIIPSSFAILGNNSGSLLQLLGFKVITAGDSIEDGSSMFPLSIAEALGKIT